MSSELKVFTAQQLKAANPKSSGCVIESVLPIGLVTIAAPPKTGKSWLGLSIGDAVAEGLPFWGFQTVKGTVLYLALEDSAPRLNERLKKIGSRMPNNLHLAINGASTIGNGLIEQLTAWADANPEAKLIIIDTIGRVKGAHKPGMNAYEADTQAFAPLQQFAVNRKLCIIAITHFSKAKNISLDDPFERITGSTGLFGVSDAAWIISGKRGEDQTLRITGRDIDDAEYKIRFSNYRWTLLGDSEELETQTRLDEYKRSALISTIRELVKHGHWEGTAKQIFDAMWSMFESSEITTVNELGKRIHQYRDLLSSVDHINYSQNTGGRTGRMYRFSHNDHSLIT